MKTMNIKKIAIIPLIGAVVFSMASCKNGPLQKFKDIEKIETLRQSFEVVEGETIEIPLFIHAVEEGKLLDHEIYDIEYSSQDNTVATFVDGVVTGVALGTTFINITIKSPDRYKEKQKLTVDAVVSVIELSHVEEATGVAFAKSEYNITQSEKNGFYYTVTPSTAYVKKVRFQSENGTVCSVNEQGIFEGIDVGSSAINIFLTTLNKQGAEVQVTAMCQVNVAQKASNTKLTGIKIDPQGPLTLYINDTLQLNITAEPENAVISSPTWTSSADGVASVSSAGLITAVGAGSATLTVASGKIKASVNVTVTAGSGGNQDSYGGYYKNIQKGLKGAALISALKSLLNTNKSVSYGWERFELADEHLTQTDSVLCIYSRLPYKKNDHVSGSEGWNREHSYPQSKISGDALNDNHHLFASDNVLNNTRSSDKFGKVSGNTYERDGYGRLSECKSGGGYFEPCDAAKGEVARATFYISVVYGNSIAGNFSSQALALEWHAAYGVTQRETIRNTRVLSTQRNRNPFIDFPEWARICFDSSYSGPGVFL